MSFGGREKLWPVFLNEAQRSVHDRNACLRLSDDEEHRSASCSRLTEARSEQQLSGQPRSLFLSVSKDAVCLCLKSGAVSDFHADVRLEQAGDF